MSLFLSLFVFVYLWITLWGFHKSGIIRSIGSYRIFGGWCWYIGDFVLPGLSIWVIQPLIYWVFSCIERKWFKSWIQSIIKILNNLYWYYGINDSYIHGSSLILALLLLVCWWIRISGKKKKFLACFLFPLSSFPSNPESCHFLCNFVLFRCV